MSWGNCSMFGIASHDPNLMCGFHEVPMDYQDQNAGKARLAVAKYAATATQKAGTIFINPGERTLRSVSPRTNLVSQVDLVTLGSRPSHGVGRILARFSRELSMSSPGILAALVTLQCTYPNFSRRHPSHIDSTQPRRGYVLRFPA